VRLSASLLGIIVCILLIIWAGRIGISQALARYSFLTHSIPAAAEAVRLSPSNADAHRALATTFRNVQMYREAEHEFSRAASLRPNDDLIWLDLGSARDELDDQHGALSALDQAVACAPYYAHTRWERANVRLRIGRYDEAFPELRAAAVSNRVYLPTLIDLAWGLSRGDAKLTEQVAGIESDQSRIAFARYLASKGKGTETLEQVNLAASSFSEDQKRQLIRSLMAAHEYEAALAIWSGSNSATTQIYDGGFEGQVSYDESGFGWSIPRQTNVEVSLDSSDKETGSKSIRVAYNGNSPSNSPVVSQTVVVKPSQKYRVNFAVKAKGIVTGGLPLLSVTDATNEALLSKLSLPQESASWQKQSINLTTPSSCKAIVVKLVRNECQSSPCPIFGVLWFDSFSIEEIKQ